MPGHTSGPRKNEADGTPQAWCQQVHSRAAEQRDGQTDNAATRGGEVRPRTLPAQEQIADEQIRGYTESLPHSLRMNAASLTVTNIVPLMDATSQTRACEGGFAVV